MAEGGDITALLRAYRYGHSLMWDRWSDHVAQRVTDATRLHDVLAMSSQHIFTFIDRACERLVSNYHDEHGVRPRIGRSVAEVVRDLLDGRSVDETQASTALRCDVRGYHLALALSPLAAGVDMQTAADGLAAAAGGAALVTLPVGDGSLWAWLSWPSRPDQERLESIRGAQVKETLIGMGEIEKGMSGFARSHQQARDANRIARLNRNVRGGVVCHRDIELAGALCSEFDRARRFAEDRLGALINDDPTMERLRETVLVYLENGCRQSRAAEMLHVHPKTVGYRLAQAEKLLSQPLVENVLEIGAALVIAQTLRGSRWPQPAARRGVLTTEHQEGA